MHLGSSLEELKKQLEAPGDRYHIDADNKGQVECVTWTTEDQLSLLKCYPHVIMMDGTYKVAGYLIMYSIIYLIRH